MDDSWVRNLLAKKNDLSKRLLLIEVLKEGGMKPELIPRVWEKLSAIYDEGMIFEIVNHQKVGTSQSVYLLGK